MRNEAWDQNQVDGSIAHHLIGDGDVAALDVPRLGQLEVGHRANLAGPSIVAVGIAEINPTLVYWIVCLHFSYGSFATGSSRRQVRPCPLCPDCDEIPHRSEMTRGARNGSGRAIR